MVTQSFYKINNQAGRCKFLNLTSTKYLGRLYILEGKHFENILQICQS